MVMTIFTLLPHIAIGDGDIVQYSNYESERTVKDTH